MDINSVSIIVGRRGSGKTDYGKECLMRSPLPKKLIVDTFDSPPWRTMETFHHPQWQSISIPKIEPSQLERWTGGTCRMFDKDPEMLIDKIDDSGLKNAVIYFEDATRYIRRTLQQSVINLIYDSKQRGLNLVFFFHSLAAVPPELIRISDYLILHKTGDNKSVLSKYPVDSLHDVMQYLTNSEDQYARVTIPLN